MMNSDPLASESAATVLSLEEAAELLGVTPNWLRYKCRDGSVPAFKLPGSRRWKIKREVVESMLHDSALIA